MRRATSTYERKNNENRRRSWFNGPFFNMFSSEPPSPERRQSVELKRPQSFIEERSRPKLYKFLSKATKRYVKTPIEIKNVPEQQHHHHQDDIPQTSLIKPDEDEADRIQLKNDLVKLAFEG